MSARLQHQSVCTDVRQYVCPSPRCPSICLPVSQVSELLSQIALLSKVVKQKDSTLDELTHSHGIEAGELKKQVEGFRRQLTETRESLCARLAAAEEVRFHTPCVCVCVFGGSICGM